MCDTAYPRNHAKSVVTVGPRATLPSIYVENELTGNSGSTNLRFRNRISGEESTIPNKSIDSSFDRSLGSSLRSTPSYGTPGTTSSLSNLGDDYGTPDSGFTGFRRIPERSSPLKKIPRPVHEPNPHGSFLEETIDTITTTKGVDVLEQTPITHDERIKAKLEEIQRRWRHHQRRAALFGSKDFFGDIFDSMSDLDTVKEILPLVVTTIIIASCIVTVCLLSSGLVRNPSAIKMPDNVNGKYRSIEFGRTRLTDRLKRENRIAPSQIKDENGVVLGGKKAAIQFAYNLRKQQDGGMDAQIDPNAEAESVPEAEPKDSSTDNLLDELSLKVASNVVNLYDKLSKETGGTSEEEAQRQELLNKIRKFGHFATTKIAPKELELDSKSDESKPVGKSETKEPEKAEAPEGNSGNSIPKVELKVKFDPKMERKAPKKKAEKSPKQDPFKKFIKSDEEKKSQVPVPKEKASIEKTQPKETKKSVPKDEDDPFR